MNFTKLFPNDSEFLKLLAHENTVDLSAAALELARDDQPELDFAPTMEWIERRGDELRPVLLRADSERLMLKNLGRCLAGTHGLHGTSDAYQRAESSYLNRVVATGVGIPISLAMAYIAVGQVAGLDLCGVSTPMHFLVRFDGLDGPLFIDAFGAGRVMSRSNCLRWLGKLTGMSLDELVVSLEPAQPRVIVTRMLNNLKGLHVRQQNWKSAYRVQQRLLALEPSFREAHRDLGMIAVKAEKPHEALAHLEPCLKWAVATDREVILRHISAAESQLAAWN